MSQLVIDGPEWWAEAAPDKTAVTFEGDSLTYRELDEWATRTAKALADKGVEPGDRVGIMAGNSLEYCVAVIGMMKAGAVVVPMNTRLTETEQKVLTDSSEPRLVLKDPEIESIVSPLRNGEPIDFPRPDIDPEGPVALIYTSGTTGTPKGVMFTHRTVLNNFAEWKLTEPGFNHDMRQLMVLPLGGAPGTIWGIVLCFLNGATFVLHRQFNPEAALKSLEEDKITMMLGVPVLFEQISVQPGWADADLSSWDTAHVGGAPVSGPLLNRFKEKGVVLRQIYGMTEAGGSAIVNHRWAALDKPEMCGTGSMFTKVKVVRDDGSECDPGEEGELIIKGPGVTPGYWGNPEATAEAIKDGWMYSGDIGVTDEQGFIRIVDRKKDLIISGGLNIAPAEIENTIMEIDGVAEVAVIGAQDEKFGETPAALIGANGEVTAEQVVAHCNEKLSDYKVPRYVLFLSEPLPRMPSGKIAKRILRDDHKNVHETAEKVR